MNKKWCGEGDGLIQIHRNVKGITINLYIPIANG